MENEQIIVVLVAYWGLKSIMAETSDGRRRHECIFYWRKIICGPNKLCVFDVDLSGF